MGKTVERPIPWPDLLNAAAVVLLSPRGRDAREQQLPIDLNLTTSKRSRNLQVATIIGGAAPNRGNELLGP
jgi:hypothetical protein